MVCPFAGVSIPWTPTSLQLTHGQPVRRSDSPLDYLLDPSSPWSARSLASVSLWTKLRTLSEQGDVASFEVQRSTAFFDCLAVIGLYSVRVAKMIALLAG